MDIDSITGERLLSAIRRNQVVLFLGSGFSRRAQNKLHKQIPDGRGLAAALWEYLEYKEPYDGADLQTVFSAAMNSIKGHKALTALLEGQLLCSDIPYWYDTLSHVFWYRIYTTNIDDLVEQVFSRSSRVANIDRVIATTEDYRDRDQFLYTIQYVKLHGTLPGSLRDITFSWRQYGQRLGSHDPWYDHFVRDYCTRMTVLIGTELNEPWFWQHIESRDRRTPGQSEHRPDAFLVCPTISPAKENSLKDMNVIAVKATAEEFFMWLQENIKTVPDREHTLTDSRPELRVALEQSKGTITRREARRIEQFYDTIHPVHLPTPNASHRKLYLLGSSPDWQDFAHNFDAPRDINQFLAETIRDEYAKPSPSPIALLGSAGCGKARSYDALR